MCGVGIPDSPRQASAHCKLHLSSHCCLHILIQGVHVDNYTQDTTILPVPSLRPPVPSWGSSLVAPVLGHLLPEHSPLIVLSGLCHKNAVAHRQDCLTMFCTHLEYAHLRVCSVMKVCHSCPAASPFVLKSDQPQEELVDVAVNGTHNVLSSVAKNKESIRRVLVTSSFAGGPMWVRDGAVHLCLPTHQSSCSLAIQGSACFGWHVSVLLQINLPGLGLCVLCYLGPCIPGLMPLSLCSKSAVGQVVI